MRLLSILFLFALTSCNDPKSCAGYGCEYDSVTEHGIRYRNDVGDGAATMKDVDRAYMHVSECIGVWYQPDVLFIATNDIPEDAAAAHIISDNKFIVVSKPHNDELVRIALISHEFVHHLLYQSTGNGDAAHTSNLFELCTSITSN